MPKLRQVAGGRWTMQQKGERSLGCSPVLTGDESEGALASRCSPEGRAVAGALTKCVLKHLLIARTRVYLAPRGSRRNCVRVPAGADTRGRSGRRLIAVASLGSCYFASSASRGRARARGPPPPRRDGGIACEGAHARREARRVLDRMRISFQGARGNVVHRTRSSRAKSGCTKGGHLQHASTQKTKGRGRKNRKRTRLDWTVVQRDGML